jgi:hypothetical protein
MAHATHAVLGRQLADPEEALLYIERLSAAHSQAYGELASLRGHFTEGQGTFLMRPNSADTRKQAPPAHARAQQMGKLGNRTASLPQTQRCKFTTTKSTRSARATDTQSRWLNIKANGGGGLRGPANGKAPRIGSASEIQPAEPEMNSSYTDKAERRTIHAFRFQRGSGTLLGAHLTRQKSRNGHSQAETARLTLPYASRECTHRNKRRTQTNSRWQPNSPPELAAKQHQPNTHLNPSRNALRQRAPTPVNGTQHKPPGRKPA